jgi:hypothetical protein
MCYTSLIHVDTRWLYEQVTFNIINRDELTRIPGLRRLCKPVLQIYDILVWIRIRIWIQMRIRILLISSLIFKMPTKLILKK